MVTLLTLDSERPLPYQAPADFASDITLGASIVIGISAVIISLA
jgi:hypothetical protein